MIEKLILELKQIQEENNKLYQDSLELEKQIYKIAILRDKIRQNNIVFQNIINEYLIKGE